MTPEDPEGIGTSVFDTPPSTNTTAHHVTVKTMGEIVPITHQPPRPKPVVVEVSDLDFVLYC